MKYIGMPMGMWMIFSSSFKKQLNEILGISKKEAEAISSKARNDYHEIIDKLPEFEKEDRFKMNIVNAAMLTSYLKNMNQDYSLEKITDYYRESMMIPAMKWFCRRSGKNKFSTRDIESMKKTAALKAADRNPYSWNMEFYPFGDNKGYEARFTKCGICKLLKEYGFQKYIPAMCQLDYTMAEAGGVSNFVRKYTIASGGEYCDCGYYKK